ncbi:hypothetical protein OSB04_029039 [Centaurea solstitialis]|uniref:TIR domain-containing protein n=1 Tax=Centaurea solstitialis TaxID=347529 RepID=A0AA38SHP1_9ASTR|nr:hypothetical protein OSB04_029039 [Centaurea solstitialis]
MAFSSSSSSKPREGSTYDVFLSFRGEDTRYNFLDHLYAALVRYGLCVFKDDQIIQGGEKISPKLLEAIKGSRCAVVVLSKNYANSSWCLIELTKIMECHDQKGQLVIPVFYHLDPSDVRKQKRDFDTAFRQHEKSSKEIDEVNEWRGALTAISHLSGHHISDTIKEGESTTINKIVQQILDITRPRSIDKNLIGIESRIDKVLTLLRIEATQEVRLVGIYGMGGIGKTTLAQALFRRISHDFEGSSFVKNVREKSSSGGVSPLQEKILKDILGRHHNCEIEDPEDGATMIQTRLRNKKVLIVIDDVDHANQLEFLAGTPKWFGAGSRIIITTRDEHLLSDTNANYKAEILLYEQAIELFGRHAFRKNSPPEGYKELSNRAISYTGCLPLALKVLGSLLRERQADEWRSALDRLSTEPDGEILKTLKISFNGLKKSEQQIFLDIACFFKGEEKERVIRILDSFGFHPTIGVRALINKSLISVSKGKLVMHDLLQETGLHIVRESYPGSRLCEKIKDYIRNKRVMLPYLKFIELDNLDCLERFPDVSGAPNLESLELSFIWNLVEVHGSVGSHRKIVHLRIIVCSKLKCLPHRFEMEALETLEISSCGSLEIFPEVSACMVNLSAIDLHYCSNLKSIPNSICELKSLKTLNLQDCNQLRKFPEDLGSLEKLSLGFQEHPYVNRISESTNLHTLRNLCLLRVLDLNERQIEDKDFFDILDTFSSLEELYMCGNSKLVQLPTSISRLSCLKLLDLNECKQLKIIQALPSGIQRYADLDRWLSIHIPGSKIPSWFEEQQQGSEITLKLSPKCRTAIIGFASIETLSRVSSIDPSLFFSSQPKSTIFLLYPVHPWLPPSSPLPPPLTSTSNLLLKTFPYGDVMFNPRWSVLILPATSLVTLQHQPKPLTIPNPTRPIPYGLVKIRASTALS